MSHDQVLASIPNMVRVSARKYTDHVALIDGDARWTYEQLERGMLDSAKALMVLGVKAGDRVALCAPNSIEWIQAALGIQAVGGVVVPVNTRFKGREIGHILVKSDASAFLTWGEFLGFNYVDAVRAAVPDCRALERTIILNDQEIEGTETFHHALAAARDIVADADVHACIDAIGPDDLSDIMFTSGTTGAPKGAQITHGQSLHAYGDMGDILNLTDDDCILVIPPFFHAFGYKAGWMMGFIFGCTVIPQRTFEPAVILQRIQAHGVSCIFGPPTLFRDLMEHPDLPAHDISSLRTTVVSAATIPVQLIHDLHDILKFDVVMSGYGLTEASAIVAVTRPGDPPDVVATTAGSPFPDVSVKIVDDTGAELGPGEQGEILVGGYNVMRGYWEEPEATAAAITSDGWLRTGDVGMMNAAGYITVTDRKKDMFIVGGFNAYPAEIENVLSSFDKIVHVAVIGIPDERMGEVGAAFVVPKPGSNLTEADVIGYARANLANFKVPRRVIIVDDLPRNASMKVLKNELRALITP